MSRINEHIVLCNGAPKVRKHRLPQSHISAFNFTPNTEGFNLTIGLPHFIRTINLHLPNKVKDLLEIASCIYAMDRMIKRGNPESVEYTSWSRKINFHTRVRDSIFWNDQNIKQELTKALVYMSGDLNYTFDFLEGGQDIGQTSLFDVPDLELPIKGNSVIALFSGGLDSLAGALTILEETNQNLILVSHRSSNPSVRKIQDSVYKLLKKDYGDRVSYFPFSCNLSGIRAEEETQRTRVFLYTAIATSLLSLSHKNEIYVFENGVTSINLPKRQDLMNSRASRTTHPRTVNLLENFYKHIYGSDFCIKHPFIDKTKTDVLNIIKKYKKLDYLNSTISCTKTFNISGKTTNATHCGGCSQCIDRRIAFYAAEIEEYDAPYDIDPSKDEMEDAEALTHLRDYIRISYELSRLNFTKFQFKYLNELEDLTSFHDPDTQQNLTEKYFDLFNKHSNFVALSLKRIRANENLFEKTKDNTIFKLIDSRDFLKTPHQLLTEKISSQLKQSIPIAFRSDKPKNEHALNDHIQAIINQYLPDYAREFPTLKISTAKTVPDHSDGLDYFVEAKYLRGQGSSASKITDQLAADVFKYGKAYILFIIYDPESKIYDEQQFKKDFEGKNCSICIIK